jgi:4-hydroxythreonine-4-phosphate dehydrogenase
LTEDDSELLEFPMPLVITAGDPAGIGPEVTHRAVRLLQRRKQILQERPVAVIGDAWLYARMLKRPREMQTYHIFPVDDFIANPGYMLEHIEPKANAPWRPIFLDCGFKDEHAVPIGEVSDTAGERAATYLGAAVEILGDDLSDAVCTAPICKESMSEHDFPFPGQTEMFADACDVRHPVMMLTGGKLRVALATIHEPLAAVPGLITRKLLRTVFRVVYDAMINDFGVPDPRIAVCGLNPHAGESGRFGEEDTRVIQPVVKSFAAKGWKIEGPLAADSVFHHAKAGRYDAVIAMYHDQGLIPVKTLAFYKGINVTLGLPVVRTSPDHGTAFDIAGKGKADPGAMYEALILAHQLASRRATTYAAT